MAKKQDHREPSQRLFADLHIHSHYSDGYNSPQEIIDSVLKHNIHCIAISDHDTIAGVAPTKEIAAKYDIEVIPAIELSSEIHGKDVHILGYGFDYQNLDIIDQFNIMQRERVLRMEKMIEKLGSFGINNISLKDVCALAESDSVGRLHLARILKEKRWVHSIREAFNKYIDEYGPAYVPKFKQTPEQAIALIKKARGVSVLAHPMLTRIDEMIPGLVAKGLDGLEVFYPNVSKTIEKHYINLAKKHNLLLTGGSDAHGEGKQTTFIGKVKIPYEYVMRLKDRLVSG